MGSTGSRSWQCYESIQTDVGATNNTKGCAGVHPATLESIHLDHSLIHNLTAVLQRPFLPWVVELCPCPACSVLLTWPRNDVDAYAAELPD
jgi:hypothetical protein